MYKRFTTDQESHEHSLFCLQDLAQYSSFMESIGNVLDIGCGSGIDAHWWATRTMLDDNDNAIPLNIRVTGIDILNKFDNKYKHVNIEFKEMDFEKIKFKNDSFDVIWAHDVLQYAINPLRTIREWCKVARDDAMLCLAVPETTNVVQNKVIADQYHNEYYHYTIVNLIHMLAVNGWDCKDASFYKRRGDPWLWACVYKAPKFKKLDHRTATWFDMAEQNLLPDSAMESVNTYGYVRFQDLKLTWLDKNWQDFSHY